MRHRLRALAGTRLIAHGVLVIEARRHRTQAQNRDDARERLVARCATAPDAAAPAGATHASCRNSGSKARNGTPGRKLARGRAGGRMIDVARMLGVKVICGVGRGGAMHLPGRAGSPPACIRPDLLSSGSLKIGASPSTPLSSRSFRANWRGMTLIIAENGVPLWQRN